MDRSGDGLLNQQTLKILRAMSRDSHHKVCMAVSKKTARTISNDKLNIVLNGADVRQQIERVWRSQSHQTEAELLLLNGAARATVEEVTGLHPRDIGQLRERLRLGRTGTSEKLTPGEQRLAQQAWDELDGLSDTYRLMAVKLAMGGSISRIWDVVKANSRHKS